MSGELVRRKYFRNAKREKEGFVECRLESTLRKFDVPIFHFYTSFCDVRVDKFDKNFAPKKFGGNFMKVPYKYRMDLADFIIRTKEWAISRYGDCIFDYDKGAPSVAKPSENTKKTVKETSWTIDEAKPNNTYFLCDTYDEVYKPQVTKYIGYVDTILNPHQILKFDGKWYKVVGTNSYSIIDADDPTAMFSIVTVSPINSVKIFNK